MQAGLGQSQQLWSLRESDRRGQVELCVDRRAQHGESAFEHLGVVDDQDIWMGDREPLPHRRYGAFWQPVVGIHEPHVLAGGAIDAGISGLAQPDVRGQVHHPKPWVPPPAYSSKIGPHRSGEPSLIATTSSPSPG